MADVTSARSPQTTAHGHVFLAGREAPYEYISTSDVVSIGERAMKSFRMNLIDWTALTLVAVGALNWGLIGVAYFVDAAANWNLVNIVFDGIPEVEFAIYVLVGLASLWTVYLASRLVGVRSDEMAAESETESRGRTTK
jgi:uncharacterized membrane protein YuzA (DUF378 family)